MDATVIEEIANQLGMAVDAAAQFVTDILPQYAGMMMLRNGVGAAILLVLIIACGVVCFCVSKYTKARVEREKDERCGYDEGDRCFTLMLTATVAGAVALFLIVLFGLFLIDAVSWALYPEAMLLDMALERVA